MSPNLNDVLVFSRVVEAGGFTAAAARLGLPKSTVSRRVMRLERALGARLLQRTTRKLRLTDAGAIYYGHCNRVLSELEAAERCINKLEESPRGVLRVTAPGDVGPFLAELVVTYQARYPEVVVVAELSTRQVDLVAEGFDVALRGGHLRDSSLMARRLASARSRLWASPGYLQKCGEPTTPQQLQDHGCLLFGVNIPQATWRLTGPSGDVQVDVSGPLSSNDLGFLRDAAVAGAGIANLPGLSGKPPTPLVRVLPDYEGSASGLYAVYPSSQLLSPKVRCFIDLAAELVEDQLLPESA